MKDAKDRRGGMVVSIVHSMNPDAGSEDDGMQAKADALKSMYENMKKGDFLAAASDFKDAYDLCYEAHEDEGDQGSDESSESDSGSDEMTKQY